MSFFIFNDYNSETDLIIRQPFIRPSWANEMNEIATGSVAKIIQFSKTFGNCPLDIPVVMKDTSKETVRNVFKNLHGAGTLVLSSNTDEYINAVANVLRPEAVSQNMAELTVSFTLLPFAYAVQPTVVELKSSDTWIENIGTVYAAPLICFTPSAVGDITFYINGDPFIVRIPDSLIGKELFIDSDIETTYYIENGVKKSINQLTYNDYPLMGVGNNVANYNGSISSAELTLRERWI